MGTFFGRPGELPSHWKNKYFSSHFFFVLKNVSRSSLVPWRVISLIVLSTEGSAVYFFGFALLQSMFGLYHGISH